jgi:hypothetical protein
MKVAWNCCVVPLAIEGLAGVTPMELTDTHAPVVVLQCGALTGHWVSFAHEPPSIGASGGGGV